VEPVADDASLDTDSVEVNGVEPRPSDVVGGLCQDLEVRGSGTSAPSCIAPGDAVPTLSFSGVVGLGATGLRMADSPSSSSPPVNWGQVTNSVE
jgi:hypothetical protein